MCHGRCKGRDRIDELLHLRKAFETHLQHKAGIARNPITEIDIIQRSDMGFEPFVIAIFHRGFDDALHWLTQLFIIDFQCILLITPKVSICRTRSVTDGEDRFTRLPSSLMDRRLFVINSAKILLSVSSIFIIKTSFLKTLRKLSENR